MFLGKVVWGNTTQDGGGIAFGNTGFASVRANVTCNGTAAGQNGGAIARLFNSDSLSLLNVTIAGTAAGGAGSTQGGGAVYTTSGAIGISARNAILASRATSNGIATTGGNGQGALVDRGNNL